MSDDIESLQQRHAGFQHGGELAREQSDVFFSNLAYPPEEAFLILVTMTPWRRK